MVDCPTLYAIGFCMGARKNGKDVHYGKALQELRKQAGLNQKDVAGKTGVTQATVSIWESSPQPPFDGIIQYLDALGLDLTDLFGQAHLSQEEQELLRLYSKAPEGVRRGVMEILRGWRK
ncbi:MAG: hypothetical protein CVV44_04030 [Spirochaetae bacterium HGW-Spirochaetae-1]|nr:MAG: hypothetical protein CVV44_04030 [Spirochaetae bacterium HGW-Spirochaetae-1]